jgi:microcin C transport system substrate-binding protein
MRNIFLFFTLINVLNAKPQYAISIYGNLKYADDFKHFDYHNPNAQKGGKFRFALLGTFDSLNPYIVKGTAVYGVSFLTQGSLMLHSADESSSQYAYIAESIDVVEDEKRVIFKINPRAQFSDGVKITSHDVKFSFDILREQGLPLFRNYYKNINNCETPDDQTIIFHIDNWNHELPQILAQMPVFPKHYYEKNPFDQTSLTPPPSSGPYVIKDVKAGQSITYERIKDWWAEKLPIQNGANNFDIIEFSYYRDATAQFEAFKSGLIDWHYELNSKTWVMEYDFPAVEQGHVVKKVCDTLLPKPTVGFFLNLRHPDLQDKRVRKALTFVFDFEWVNKNIYYNLYKRNHSFFPVSGFDATGLPDADETAFLKRAGVTDPEIFNTEYTLPVMCDQNVTRKTTQEALDLLKQAGWELKNNKMTNIKTGKVLTLEFIYYVPNREKLGLAYQKSLSRLGITLNMRRLDRTTYEEKLANFDYDLVYEGIQQSATLGNEQREYFGSKAACNKGTRNYSGIQSEIVDHIIDQLIDVKDYPSLVTACKALDRVLLREYIMIPAWHFNGYMTAFWDRFGGTETVPPYMLTHYPHGIMVV